MSEDKAEVIDGEIGSQSHVEFDTVPPDELEHYEKNTEIYGDTDDVDDLEDNFIESVREKGVLEPLVVTQDDEIISGHRRHLAASHVGLDEIPIRRKTFETELDKREALIEHNRQREKTPGQVVNEFEEMVAIEEERAEKRMSEGGEGGVERSGNVSNPSEDVGAARDKAAEKIGAGVTGRTIEKGKKVKEKAESGDEKAKEEWEKMKEGETTFHSAYEEVKDSQEGGETEDEENGDIEQFTSQETDEWSSPRHLVEPIDEAVGGFDLDPCSGAEESPFAEETYTEDDDGLSQDWFGNVWVNPPYSEMQDWTDKAVEENNNDEVDSIVYLCKGDSSTQWWQNAVEHVSAICAIEGRLSFGDGENAAPFASHILVFGESDESLFEELSNHGTVLTVGW